MKKYVLNLLIRLERIGIDSFLLLLLSMIGLAYLFPAFGTKEGIFSLKNITDVGVFVIFFFYGLRLGPNKLKAGLSNPKLHLVIHASTFIIFPLIALAVKKLFSEEYSELWLGIFYLSALPSTVSSAVVMVSIARGNIPAAIFNAGISGILGIFITPLWISMVIAGRSGNLEVGEAVFKLILQVLLPVIAGILLNRFWGDFAEKHKKTLRKFDQSIILLIVYTAFCESFSRHAFENLSLPMLIICSIGMVVLFFLIYSIIGIATKTLRFRREDRITALFCGSKKSLVHGTVMSNVLFPGSISVGIILLPTMLYHALQLIIVSAIARRMSKQSEQREL